MHNCPDKLLNEKEAADFLKVSVSLIQKMRCRGKGPSYLKITPRCIRYNRSELHAYAESKKIHIDS